MNRWKQVGLAIAIGGIGLGGFEFGRLLESIKRTRASAEPIAIAIYSMAKVGNLSEKTDPLCPKRCREELARLERDFGRIETFEFSNVESRGLGLPIVASLFVTRRGTKSTKRLVGYSTRLFANRGLPEG